MFACALAVGLLSKHYWTWQIASPKESLAIMSYPVYENVPERSLVRHETCLCMQVGWEISKVVETLKASGHEVSLVINAGSSSANHTPLSEDLPNGNQVDTGGDDNSALKLRETPLNNSRLLTHHNTDPCLTGSSQSTNFSDGMSSSQDTLDDIAESPVSFEGDTDFSGMEKILMKSKVLDLHRTSSAPLTHRERAVVMEASTESGSSLGGGKGSICSGETASLDCLDSGESSESQSYESRLQMRTSSDGTVPDKAKKKVKWSAYSRAQWSDTPGRGGRG